RAVITQDTFLTDVSDHLDKLAAIQPRQVMGYTDARAPVSGAAAFEKAKVVGHARKVSTFGNVIIGWAGVLSVAAAWLQAVQFAGIVDVCKIDDRAADLWNSIPLKTRRQGPLSVVMAGFSPSERSVWGYTYSSSSDWASHALGRGHLVLPVPPEEDWRR